MNNTISEFPEINSQHKLITISGGHRFAYNLGYAAGVVYGFGRHYHLWK